ncbi:hypothetical protein TruAng_005299 [Truncatella angustata]|nr:hypothetical protein TruAng_005299 [Truncatella angustata]
MEQTIPDVGSSEQASKRAAEEKARDDLEVLQKMMHAKFDEYQLQLNEKFLNAESVAKTQVPGTRALRWHRRVSVQISDQPADEADEIIDSFLQIGDDDDKGASRKGFKVCSIQSVGRYIVDVFGIKTVVKSALDRFLKNTATGQQEEEKFFIYAVHNTIVRVDIKLFKWNLAVQGFSDVWKGLLGYIICLSVVDPTKLDTDEFVYLISEYAGKLTDQHVPTNQAYECDTGDNGQNVNNYVEFMQKIYSTARQLKLDQSKTSHAPDDR